MLPGAIPRHKPYAYSPFSLSALVADGVDALLWKARHPVPCGEPHRIEAGIVAKARRSGGLVGLGFDGRGVGGRGALGGRRRLILVHRPFEIFNSAPHRATNVAEFARSEDDQDDQQQYKQMRRCENVHKYVTPEPAELCPPISSRHAPSLVCLPSPVRTTSLLTATPDCYGQRLTRGVCGGPERDHRFALRAHHIRTGARLALEGIDQPHLLAHLAHRGQHFLAEQADIGHPIGEADRSLCREEAEDTRTQRLENPANLGQDALRGPGDDRHALLGLFVAAVDSGLGIFDRGLPSLHPLLGAFFAGLILTACPAELLGADSQGAGAALAGGRASQAAGRLLRVIAGRQRMLGAREVDLAAAEQMASAKRVGLRLGLRNLDVLQIAEVLRTGEVTLLRRDIAVDIPQLDGRLQAGAEAEVEIAMPRAPFDRFRTEHARNPDGRARLLIRGHPRINEAIVEILALPAERTRPRPGGEDNVMRFVEELAV